MAQYLLYLWAFPATCLGLLFVPLALIGGGTARRIQGVLEIQGGLVQRLFRSRLPFPYRFMAITLGHVVLGLDQQCLDVTRAHERIHVRQFERWGPLMIPLYLLSSLLAYLRGRDPYRDNRFEREAYTQEGKKQGSGMRG
ncbi:MAG: hypothetical protein HYY20_05530 [Candidatus Tectomicrobia bacterium]|uniref:Signal peptide prediction n=1 Tax=Tectimicrobiota bacterium TaxID=2528274 RepID=A0A932CNF1_UNCTE|nr:hypothetical protein [Candidatus Tectomicrobia bacterium]